MQDLKNAIIEKAEELGIHKIGFTHASPFSELEDGLREQRAKGYNSGFEHQNIEERIYPDLTFQEPKSIIAIGIAYPSRPKIRPVTRPGEPRGSFARASWGRDYHFILREKMDELVAFIEQEAGRYGYDNPRFKPMVDTGELVDVAVAQRAGLGFVGRNGLLITKEYGSYLYLGEIVTNLEFEPDKQVDYDCGDCYRCIDACPTQALLGDGRINAQVCLSYQTQTKGYMPEEFRDKMGRVIYGCDICQIVCPYNKGMNIHDHPDMEPDPETTFPELKPMLTISNREFQNQFGEMAGSWRGKKPLQRNAIIALANHGERSAVPNLLALIEEDPRPMIRGTAAWAIAKIVGESENSELLSFLEAAREKETVIETLEEFTLAIAMLRGTSNET